MAFAELFVTLEEMACKPLAEGKCVLLSGPPGGLGGPLETSECFAGIHQSRRDAAAFGGAAKAAAATTRFLKSPSKNLSPVGS
ncbi:hypothetical protein EYF80_022206 [Liparis tanakae]|uniref:Uncharacterized protein n=1 Tax=Liparis tanakae TaxID=230148 RepID=A0A4Z2HRA1_9TELE|nr:hypothetical protein EYF80_022206 [Liparis tanakae]